MSDEVETICKCKECDNLVPDDAKEGEQRIPCPQCGSTGRNISFSVTDEARTSDGYHLQGFSERRRPKKPGKPRKPFIDDKSMEEVYRVDSQTYRVERTIDYENNTYRERIANPRTNEVVRSVEEPLSEHRGHGSAKK